MNTLEDIEGPGAQAPQLAAPQLLTLLCSRVPDAS